VKVVVLPNALERYRRTLDLVYAEASREVLDRLTDRVFDHIGLLARYPGLGALDPQLQDLNMGHRRLVVGNFKVVYRVDGDTVLVVDIFDARRDPREMIG